MAEINEVIEIIQILKKRIIDVEQNNTKLSETDTRQGLINPLFRVLGWDFGDFQSVKSEVRHKSYNEPVDYAFFSSKSSDKPVLLMEAKQVGKNLNDPKIVKQLCTYLGEMGVQWGVLTDGNKYVMYNSGGGSSFEDQRFLTIQIKTTDTEDGLSSQDLSEKLLALLSRDCLENEEIQNTYEQHLINAQVERALSSLLSTPFGTLITSIRREFKESRVCANSNIKITSKQIQEYLDSISDEEGKIRVDLEATEIHSDNQIIQSVVESHEQSDQPGTNHEVKIKVHGKRVTIGDLIEDKLVTEGDNWKLEYKGEVYWGRVTGTGQLEVNGVVYTNPSKAGDQITKGACNGWYWWKYKDKDGNWNRIDELRHNYRKNHGLAAVKWKSKEDRLAA